MSNKNLLCKEDTSPLGQATQRMLTINRMFKAVVDTFNFLNQERMKLEVCINAAKMENQKLRSKVDRKIHKVTVEELEKILTEDDRVKKFCPFCGTKLVTAKEMSMVDTNIKDKTFSIQVIFR